MESLLKLQAHVAPSIGTSSIIETNPESSRRAVSIPASRLASARRHAANDALDDGEGGNALEICSFAPGHLSLKSTTIKMTPSMTAPLVTAHQTLQSVTEDPHRVDQSHSMSHRCPLSDTTSSLSVLKSNLMSACNNKGSIAYPGGAVLPALMGKVNDVECLLHVMLPPKSTVKKATGETFIQLVSSEPSSRAEVAELHERLVQRLRQRRARESGICPIRREIYADVFEELIRQTTLEEPARGILLLRVRDEMCQMLEAHRSLVEQVTCFVSKKRTCAMDNLHNLRRRIKELEEERSKLLHQRKTAEVRKEKLLSAIEEENAAREKIRQEELNYYRRANRQLSQRIKAETERAGAHGIDLCPAVLEGETTGNAFEITM